MTETVYSLRKATPNDLNEIMKIIKTATVKMNQQGNYQWTVEGYPSSENILDDINNGVSYLLMVDGVIAGTSALTFTLDQDYIRIEDGDWLTPGATEYATIHRIAISDDFKGQGLSSIFFELLLKESGEKGLNSMRIDTHETNFAMRHIMEKLGFTHVGTIFYGDSPRLAFEKMLVPEYVKC